MLAIYLELFICEALIVRLTNFLWTQSDVVLYILNTTASLRNVSSFYERQTVPKIHH